MSRGGGRGALFTGRWKREQDERLAEGGQAEIYLVTDADRTFDGPLALKRLTRLERAARFEREINVMSRLDHPSVMRVLATGTHKWLPFYVMPYYERGSLEGPEIRKAWHNRPVDALRFFASICDAVAAAHREQIVHRDIKPSNILLSSTGEPVVSDFGLCFVGEEDRLTEDWRVVGSRWFMAPELEHGRADQVTTGADVYSLGKVLYWMLSGGGYYSREDPYFAESLAVPTRDSRYEHIMRLLRQCITFSPYSRFADAAALAAAVRQLIPVFEAGDPARLIVVSGNNQQTYCRGAFQQQLVVRVEDAVGNPIVDRDVWWEADGRVSEARTTTDVEGAARTYWSPSGKAGETEARAIVGDIEPAVFRAHVRPGAAEYFQAVGFNPTMRVGSEQEFLVRVVDQCNNLVPDAGPPHYTPYPHPQTGARISGVSITPIAKQGLEPGVHAFVARAGQVGSWNFYILRGLDKSQGIGFTVVAPDAEGAT